MVYIVRGIIIINSYHHNHNHRLSSSLSSSSLLSWSVGRWAENKWKNWWTNLWNLWKKYNLLGTFPKMGGRGGLVETQKINTWQKHIGKYCVMHLISVKSRYLWMAIRLEWRWNTQNRFLLLNKDTWLFIIYSEHYFKIKTLFWAGNSPL